MPDIIPFPATNNAQLQTFFVAYSYQVGVSNWGIMTYRTDDQYQLVDPYSIDTTLNARTAFRIKLNEICTSRYYNSILFTDPLLASTGQYWMVTAMYVTDQGVLVSQIIKEEATKITRYGTRIATLPGITFTPFTTRVLLSGVTATLWTSSGDNTTIYGTAIRYGTDSPVFNFTIPAATPAALISDLIFSPLENYTFALTQVVRDPKSPSGFINYYALSNCNDSIITPNENCEAGAIGCVQCMCDEGNGWHPYDGITCVTGKEHKVPKHQS